MPGWFAIQLLRGGGQLGGGGSGPLCSSFLFYLLGELGNFVIDRFDFSSQVKILRVPGIGFEQRVPLGF